MCNKCVHVLQRKGGLPLFLCTLCSHKCERIEAVKPEKKKTLIGFLRDTVKVRFRNPIKREKL
jgi:hypothetical protein